MSVGAGGAVVGVTAGLDTGSAGAATTGAAACAAAARVGVAAGLACCADLATLAVARWAAAGGVAALSVDAGCAETTGFDTGRFSIRNTSAAAASRIDIAHRGGRPLRVRGACGSATRESLQPWL